MENPRSATNDAPLSGPPGRRIVYVVALRRVIYVVVSLVRRQVQ